MNRRDFLKSGAAGLTIPWWGVIPEAHAQVGLYGGRVLINIHADGGIDQSSWTDPRETDRTLNNYAGVTPANVSGNIRSAPMGNNKAFFDRYFMQTLVINGVNSETNSHEDGARAHATGRLEMGYPNMSELFASVYGKGLPMPWLNAGGFRTSAGLVAATPMPSVDALRALVTPNAQSANADFMKQADLDKTLAARAERMKALQARSDTLPRMRTVSQEFAASSDSRALMQRVAQFLPTTLDAFPAAHVGLVAAQAGITSTIQLSSGGFDTHSDHDNRMATALPRLTDLVDYIWQKSAALGISNRILVRIYSEFGRTPLNSGNGKDHWSVGSQVIMEAAPAWGNRVFGASGPRHQALRINTATGAVDPTNGVLIRPRHIHAALRSYLGINTTDPRFDLKVPANEMFAFFDPNARTGYPTL
ncbi:DUF1501 domain-containing protein [Betaproteobacteria bacterium PRO7]|jgi:uncharacterized protein (DUF1501 family)|nr:DUF1501 domain-containing protein [Betaproteobacteria bacterium PRO7]GIL04440.1 MAG: hypothetical protein BroJett031_09600 [Betaproteobacteria bacterium]